MRIQAISRRRNQAPWVRLLSFSICLAVASSIATAEVNQSAEFYAFYNTKCPTCQERMAVLNSTYPNNKIVVYDMWDKENVDYFNEIVEALNQTLSRDIVPYQPLVGVFENNILKVITDGANSAEDWRQIVEMQHDGVLVYFKGVGIYVNQTLEDPAKIALFERLFKKTLPLGSDASANFFSLLVPVAVAALVDAVNPCAFNSFVVFLTFALFSVGRRRVLRIGLSFSVAVFIVYFSLGLGLIRFLGSFSQIKYFVAVFAGTLGVLRIIDASGREIKFVPPAFAERLKGRLESALTPWGGFVAGSLTAALILPCSSAPYFVALGLLSSKATALDGFALLVLYNLIIVLPFVTLTLGVYAFSLSTMDMKLWAKERRRWINLSMGIALIVLSLIILF